MNTNNLPELLTPDQLATYLGCGMNKAYSLLKEGKIRAVRVGRTWRIPATAIDEYIEKSMQLEN